MDINKIESSVKTAKVIAFSVVGIVPFLYMTWFLCINGFGISVDSSHWGAFGDFFGGLLNPLIALLAFYWLTQSVLIQKTELSKTQQILIETKKAQEEQAKTQEKKRFEDTFFALLNQMNSIFSGLNEKAYNRERVQDSKIEVLHKRVFGSPNKYDLNTRVAMMKEMSSDTSHYFRIIYHILKFILENNVLEDSSVDFNDAIYKPINKTEKFYSNIVRSFLNKQVVQLLAVNCIVEDEKDQYYKYRLLIERYSLLEHLCFDEKDVWLKEIFYKYDLHAFGSYTHNKNFPVLEYIVENN